MEPMRVAEPGVMPGVKLQVIGAHSGGLVSGQRSISVDNRDCRPNNPLDTPHYFICKDLVHFTENEFADSIGSSGTDQPFSFRPFPFRTHSGTEGLKLSWWSPLPPDNWRDVVNEDIPNVFKEFDGIGNSNAIDGDSLCGPVGFVTPWKDILEQYAISRQKSLDDIIELRNLGTYLYTKEIMFAVLVCMKGDISNDDNRFPRITSAVGTEAFQPLRNDFSWKVYSTIGYSELRPDSVFWSWDHLTFGFYCPSSNLNIEPKFCRITEKNATLKRPRSRQKTETPDRSDQERAPHQGTINKLNEKIRNALRIAQQENE